MAKRIGYGRTQALIEGLKRELNLAGSTIQGVVMGGSTSTTAPGLQSGSIVPPTTRVTNIGGQIVTTIQLDLENLSGSCGVGGTVIGNPSGSLDAYLYEHSDTTNGKLYKVEFSCIEDITGGATVNADFDLTGSTEDGYSHGETPAADVFAIASTDGEIDAGQTITDSTVNSSDGAFVYLCQGATGGGTPGQYSAGKLIIRLYGHEDF